jgi:CRISPR-associated endonuclease Cas1
MQLQATPDSPIINAWQKASTNPQVVTVDGYGASLTVSGGQLVIKDGIAGQRRTRKIARVPREVSRVMILATTGMVTMEAETWLTEAGIPLVRLTQGNRITSPVREDARLLRAQAYAVTEPAGLEITRALLTAKLAGQSAICRDVLRVPGASHNIDDLAEELNRAPELDDCRSLEGAAAMAYWQAWADRVTVPFSPADMLRVPPHWNRFNGRDSEIGPAHRHATDSVNALLNYVYRIAETECVLACHALGLHPQLGILHADKEGRDSMALDLIEAVRPFCDRIILGMLDVGLGVPVTDQGKPAYLDRRWFHEVRKTSQDEKTGQCKLVAPLTHQLASHAPDIGAVIRSHAEHAARILANAASGNVRVPRERKRDAVVRQGRQQRVRERVSRTSNRPVRLRDGVTAADVIPDELWKRVRRFLPEPPPGPYGHKRTGKLRDTSLDRDAVAAVAAHELLNVPWGLPRVPVSVATCRARLLEWQWTRDSGISAWDRIAGEVQGHGHLSSLVC